MCIVNFVGGDGGDSKKHNYNVSFSNDMKIKYKCLNVFVNVNILFDNIDLVHQLIKFVNKMVQVSLPS